MDLVNRSSKHRAVHKKRGVFKYKDKADIEREIKNQLPENGKHWEIEDYNIVGTDVHYIASTVR